MNIKICGLSTKTAVDRAVQSGATHLGFILSKSRRQVTAEQVAELTVDLPSNIEKVGVFVNESIDFVKAAASVAKLDRVQLHGDEDAAYIGRLGLPVLKAVSDFDRAAAYESCENVILLLDSPTGGSGKTFDWTVVKADTLKLPFFVAGGLTPENVSQAVQYFNHIPNFYGLDVSSVVETDGVKDLEKIKAFIGNASLARSNFHGRIFEGGAKTQ